MARLRYRWLLPFGHLLVDVIVLSHFIWQGHQWQRDLCRPPVIRTEVPASEGTVMWDPRYFWWRPPQDFVFLVAGTLPVGLISGVVRPRAILQDCDRLWDPLWFSIHEGIAFLF